MIVRSRSGAVLARVPFTQALWSKAERAVDQWPGLYQTDAARLEATRQLYLEIVADMVVQARKPKKKTGRPVAKRRAPNRRPAPKKLATKRKPARRKRG